MSDHSETVRRREWICPPATGRIGGIDLAALDPADPDERQFLIKAEHPDLAEAIRRGDDTVDIDGHPVSPRLHLALHEIVANQIWDDDPREVWRTAHRLLNEGFERHDVLHMLASVAANYLHDLLSRRETFDREEYARALDALPASGDPDPDFELLRETYELDDCCVEALDRLIDASDENLPQDSSPEHLRSLADDLAHGLVADAFIHTGAVYDAPDAAQRIREVVQPIAALARREGLAAANYVLAACAEGLRDPLEAERLLGEALHADPTYAPALETAAWYAEDRGDAPRAISLLRQAGLPDDAAAIDRLTPFAVPGPHAAGRNEPCPCGSGRKYKHCCAARRGWTLADRVHWLYMKAVAYALRPMQCDIVFDLARVRAGGDREKAAAASFDDQLVTNLALFEDRLFEDFLDVRGPLVPADELELGRRWADARLRAYDVEEVRTDEALVLRDIADNRRYVVSERLGTHSLHDGDWILAHLLPTGDGYIASAATKLPTRLREPVRELMASEPSAYDIARWLAAADAPPAMRTMEDEEIVFCEATYELPDMPAAKRALARVLKQDDAGFVQLARIKGQDYVRGFVRCTENTLVVDANSVERYDRLKACVEGAVPEAKLVAETRTPLHEAMQQPRGEMSDDDLIPPEATAALEDYISRREKQWIDEPVPALGGLTPRAALTDLSRRRDLLALLREFDGRKSGMNPDRIRSLLGIETQRP